MDDSSPWLAAAVESSDDAIITKTLQGVITSWNPAASRLFGYSSAEAIGRPMAMLVPSNRLDEEPRILARITNGERVDHFETERVRKDGSIISVSVTISPVRDPSGRIVGASKIARDISERKQADARVQAQLARLFTLDQITRAIGEQQGLADIYQVALRAVEERLPLDFACLCAADEARRQLVVVQLGSRSARLANDLAMSAGAIVPLDDESWERWTDGGLAYLSHLHGLDACLPSRIGRGGFSSMVIAPLKAKGKVASLMVCARRLPDAFSSTDCEFLLQLCTHVALAARHAGLNAELRQAYQDLKDSQEATVRTQRLQALGQMASGVAHDIGNLVFPASFFAEELQVREAQISPDGLKALGLIKACLEDVAAIVQRLRDFCRARDVSLRADMVDLNVVVRQVVDLTRPQCAERSARGIPVEVRALDVVPVPEVAGSEAEFREALVNLVLNAIDAMPGGGSVVLRVRSLDGPQQDRTRPSVVEVCVEDDGVGMDEDTYSRCMEPFFTTKGDSGTGMGLAMVYATVQRYGADITIDSAAGKGTSVSIEFPIARKPEEPTERPAGAHAAPIASTRPLRILLIDDDALVLETLENMLDASGHAITTAPGGRAGLEVFREALRRDERFDVVVTDLGMPDLDGKAVARSVKRLSSATPVILLTGWGEGLQRNDDPRQNVNAILGKPPRRRDLEDTLARLTESR